ncbi:uncharacterized protein LOC111047905 [Nilaparvata lugens]|uniref:uncharacterized protein LOC111047905 n=1 Tax=Nilaparvata lugens TaxID=108931 RepID=UPI00193DC1AC|nr:uncharacterized protein LOC111047905 [Nilaparvata lugens]
MDNPSDSDSKRKQDKHFDGDEVNTSDDLGNDSWSPQSELNNNSWNAKTEQRHNKGEKETSDNPHEQRGSLLNSRSFSPNQYIEDGEENTCGPDQCGLNFDPGQNFNDKEDEDETSLNKEIMSQHSPSRRESAVTFDEGKRKDYNEGRPSKNLTLNGSDGNTMVQSSSPQKMKVFDVILRPSHDDSASTNLSTDSLKTDKESRNSSDKNQPVDKESIGKRKREVIKINKELAPAVINLLKKLEQIQSSSTPPSPNAPDENVAQKPRRKKSLDDGSRKQQANHLIDSEKDMTEVSNFEKKESKSQRSSTSKSKRLSVESETTSRSGSTEPLTSFKEEDKDDNDQLPAMKNIRNRVTSSSTSKGFCSAEKCQRTCKRCSGIKRKIEKGDSRGDRHQEDLNIAPALEAVAEKLKDCLKIGCSLLKNVYYNQNLVRVFYFRTDPSEAEMAGEL